MAFLDQIDTVERLYSLLPAGWFPDLDDSPDLKAVLSMLGATYSNADQDGLYQFLQYIQKQTRIATAEGFWLDIIAADYFGISLQRNWPNEPDTSFRRRIMINLLAPRGSRCAVYSNVANLTGYNPEIIELRNTNDCGSYASLTQPFAWGGTAYNEAGAYGSMTMPYQLMIKAYRPPGEGIPNVSGYGMAGGGYATLSSPRGYVGGLRPQNFGTLEYVRLTDIIGPVTDKNIYDTIAQTMPAGTTAWTAISNPPISSQAVGVGLLDANFYLDFSLLAPEDTAAPGGIYGDSVMRFYCSGILQQGDLMGVLSMPLQVTGSMYQGNAPLFNDATFTLPMSVTGNLIQPNYIIPFTIGVSGSMSQAATQPILGTTFTLGESTLGLMFADSPYIFGVKAITAVGSLTFRATTSPAIVGVAAITSVGTVQGKGPSFNVPITGVSAASTTGAMAKSASRTLASNLASTSLGTFSIIKVSKTLASLQASTAIGALGISTGVPQTYSASHKDTHLTLTNSNTTVTHDGTASTWGAVYGTKTKTSGKFYWELVITSGDITQDLAGFGAALSDISDGSYVGASGTASIGWVGGSQQQVFYQSVAVATWTGAQFNSGDRICLALDLDNKKFWGRVGNGNWTGSPTANPATNTGGYDWSGATDVTGASPWTPGVSLYTSDTSTTYFQSNTWTYTAPSGFGAW